MQIFLPENLPSLVVASTTSVTVATTAQNGLATRINIGGQQYVPSSLMTLTTSGTGANGLDTGSLTVNSLWYVYAIVNQSSFVLALVASLSAPSSGPLMPSGYGTAYKLIGAFYTNGSSQVGSSVNISGIAQTGWITGTPVILTGLAIGNGTLTAKWKRDGDSIIAQIAIITGSTSAWAGSGTSLSVDLSTIISGGFDFTKMPATNANTVGEIYANTETGVSYTGTIRTNTSGSSLSIDGGNGSTDVWDFKTATRPAVFTTTAANQTIKYFTSPIPVAGWNATLL